MGGKQKVVVRVPCCNKGRSIALKTVAGLPGVSSVSLEGAEKDRVVVTGEEIDSYGLIKSLKKKVGWVELLTVGPVETPPPPDKKLDKDSTDHDHDAESVPCSCKSVPCFCQTVPQHVIYVCELCNPEPICVTM